MHRYDCMRAPRQVAPSPFDEDGDDSLEQGKQYKRRLAECVVWERRLTALIDLRQQQFPSMPGVPIAAAGDSIRPHPIRTADLLENAAAFFTPIERELIFESAFAAQNERALQALRERR
jgi:hypothetical protein